MEVGVSIIVCMFVLAHIRLELHDDVAQFLIKYPSVNTWNVKD